MGANPIMKHQAWKRSVAIVTVISILFILTGIVLQLTGHPPAGLVLIMGCILLLFALAIKWSIAAMFSKNNS